MKYRIKEGRFEGRYPLDIVLIMRNGEQNSEHNIVIPSFIGAPRVASRIVIYQKGDNSDEVGCNNAKFRRRWWFGYERRDFRIIRLKPNIMDSSIQANGKWLEAMFLVVKEIYT